jgi:tellurite resistance protein
MVEIKVGKSQKRWTIEVVVVAADGVSSADG